MRRTMFLLRLLVDERPAGKDICNILTVNVNE